VQYVASHVENSLTPWAHGRRREIETYRHARLIMTIHSHLTSTRFSSLAPMRAAEKPATPNNSPATPQEPESASETPPSLPSGLVGHLVNTTA
jgi:hypothetical protein